MRTRGERVACTRGTIPAAKPAGDATVRPAGHASAGSTWRRATASSSRWRATASSSRWRQQRLCVGTPELQRPDGRRAADSARGRRGAGRARLCRLHPPSRFADAAQCLQRVVLHRRGEDPHDLHGDVLYAGRNRRAELAAVRWQLAVARRYSADACAAADALAGSRPNGQGPMAKAQCPMVNAQWSRLATLVIEHLALRIGHWLLKSVEAYSSTPAWMKLFTCSSCVQALFFENTR